MASFTLATGLRQSNVKKLQWKNIDLAKKHAWIHAENAKGNTAIAVPLNDDAMAILNKLRSNHSVYVFTFKENPVRLELIIRRDLISNLNTVWLKS